METYKNLKKGTKVGLAISAVLCVLLLAFCTHELISPPKILPREIAAISAEQNVPASPEQMAPPATNAVNIPEFIRPVLNIALCLLIMFYAFLGYKKPHGNMLRFTFFAFSVYLLAFAMIDAMTMRGSTIENGLTAFSALLIAYISGRLNKLEKNRVLLVITGAALAVNVVLGVISVCSHVGAFELGLLLPFFRQSVSLVALAALGFAYTARYEAHKADGLEDK